MTDSDLPSPPGNEDVIIDPFSESGDRLYMPKRAQQLGTYLEARKNRGKPEDVWDAEDLSQAMGVSKGRGWQIIKSLRDQFATEQSVAQYLELQIPQEAMITYGLKIGRGQTAYGIQKAWGERIAATYKSQKGKPEGVWSFSDLAAAMGVVEGTAINLISSLRGQFAAEQPYAEYLGLQIPAEAVVRYLVEAGQPTHGIQQEWGEQIAAAYKAERGEVRGKPEGVWSPQEFGNALGLTTGRAQRIIKELRDEFSTDVPHVEYFNLQIPQEAIVKYWPESAALAYGIQQVWGERIAAIHKAEKGEDWGKPEGVWSAGELGAAIDASQTTGTHIITGLRDQFSKDKPYAEYLQLKIPSEAVVFYRTDVGHPAYGIQQTWGEQIAQAYKTREGQPAGVWSMAQFAEKLGGRDSRGIAGRLREQFDHDDALQEIAYRGVAVPRNAFVQYTSLENGKPAWGIKIEVGEQIVGSFPKLLPKPDDVWSSVELGAAMGLKKDSDAIKKLKAYFDEHAGVDTASIFGIEIPRAALVDFDLRGDTITGIKIEHGERIVAAYKQSLEDGKPSGVWSIGEFAEALKINGSTARDIVKELQEAFERDSTISHATYLGVSVPKDAIVSYKYNQLPATGITEAIGQQIVAARKSKTEGRRTKPNDVWSSVELARELGLKDTAGYSIIASLVRQAEAESDAEVLKYRGIEIPRSSLVKYDAEPGERTGIKIDAGNLIVQAYKAKKGKPDDVWSAGDFNHALDSDSLGTGIIAMIRKQLADPSHNSAKVKGVEIPRTAWIEYEYGGKPAFGVQGQYAIQLLAAYGISEPNKPKAQAHERLKAKSIIPHPDIARQSEKERQEDKRDSAERGG